MGAPRPVDLPHHIWMGCQSWEVINGVPNAMSLAPSYRYQYVIQNIAQYLCELLYAYWDCHAWLWIDWRINDDTIARPENMVVCGNADRKELQVVPSIVFELLSPSTEK